MERKETGAERCGGEDDDPDAAVVTFGIPDSCGGDGCGTGTGIVNHALVDPSLDMGIDQQMKARMAEKDVRDSASHRDNLR